MNVIAAPAIESAARAEAFRVRVIAPVMLVAAASFGVLASQLVSMDHPAAIASLGLLLVPALVWRWPQASVVVLLLGATLVESFPFTVGTRNAGALTDRIPLYRGLTYLRFAGFSVLPIECLLGLILIVCLLKAVLDGTLRLPRSALAKSIAAMDGLIVLGFFIGISHHGDLHKALVEIRPWIYLTVAYQIASMALRTRKAREALLWTLVLGSGFKAVQGAFILSYSLDLKPRPEAILAHEEAFFFGLFIALTAGLWIFQIRGRLRIAATTLVPVVLIVDMGNARRTAWAIIAISLVALLVLAYVALPERRRTLRRLSAVLALASVFYLPAYWNKDGTLAQPARAARSLIAPTARDQSSNQYRNQENVNLIYGIKGGGPLGKGFGVRIQYTGIIDISKTDSFIGYVTHDGPLYLWMRLGIQGEIVFWSMIAAAIIKACQLARSTNRELAFFGTFVVCGILAYVVQGFYDFGLDFYRIAIMMGFLLGALEAASRTGLLPTDQAQTPTAVHGVPVP